MLHCIALIAALAVAPHWDWRSAYVAAGGQDPGAEVYRCSALSGCNLLYFYATGHQTFVSYDRIRKLMSQGNRLATLRDLEVGAMDIGMDACVRKLTASDLKSLDFPIIAHLDRWNESPGSGGEFLLVIAQNGSMFEVLEGISSAPSIMTQDEFFRRWAGYALVPASGWGWQYAALGLASLLLLSAMRRKRVFLSKDASLHSRATCA